MTDLGTVTAAILAGGLGTRMRSVVADRPKVLAEVCGRPFLTYLLDQLMGAGIEFAVLCTGYLGEQVQAKFGDRYNGIRLAYSQESAPLGTAGALRLALPQFNSDQVLVLNGDSFCAAGLRSFWEWHCARESEVTILLTQIADAARFGRVQLNGQDRIIRFEEKTEKAMSGWINAGIYLIKREFLEAIPVGKPVSLEREIFPTLLNSRFYGYRCQVDFIDIGTPEAFEDAQRFFRQSHEPKIPTVCAAGPGRNH